MNHDIFQLSCRTGKVVLPFGIQLVLILRLVIIFLWFPGMTRLGWTQGDVDAGRIFEIVQDCCLDCHGPSSEAGVNLENLFLRDQTLNPDAMELWIRVEKVVSAREMPPVSEDPLVAADRQLILERFHEAFVLRNGKEHVGRTLLRRLTRYEIQNSLADVLAVHLQPPYVVSSEQTGLNLSTIEQILPDDLRGESGFSNDAYRLSQTKIPFEKLIACVDYALRIFEQDETAWKQITGLRKADGDLSPDQVKRILSGFLDRAWRGQTSELELQKILKVWENGRLSGESPDKALLHAMKIALLSPGFLYRMERSRSAVYPYAVGPKELAVRLSFFLWSTSPDQALWNAAINGKLETDEQLVQQVHRMLNSKKRISLSENFAAQWLGFDDLRTNKIYYRGENWTRGVYDELLFGFDELIRSDRSILEMVDSQWAYLRNRKYGGANVRNLKREGKYGDIFEDRRVRTGLKVERFYSPPQLYEVNNDQFGGLLTSSGIMQLTSAPNRTNPIRRGVWILEKLIGEAMHPPENIPPLSESIKKIPKNLPRQPREILKLHTSRPSCRACHQHIDPLGLGLENFSPGGEWRTAYPDKSPVNSEGTLPNGKPFTTPQQLKTELLTFYREKIVDNMVRRMLAYANGRKIFPHDRPEIERIKRVLQENDYKMVTLIEQVVLSRQFRMRQDQ